MKLRAKQGTDRESGADGGVGDDRRDGNGAVDGIYIAEAAKVAGVSPSLIRTWERQGLLSPPRSRAGYRIYRERDVRCLVAIRRLREEGLSPAAIARGLPEDCAPGCDEDPEPVPDGSAGAGGDRFVAHRLRAERLRRRMSLRELAAESDLSASHLSALERGMSYPSIASLQRLAEALGTNVLRLLGHQPRGDELVRPDQREEVHMGVPGVVFENLAQIETSLEPLLTTVEPGAGAHDPYFHAGDEFLYMLDGVLRLVLNETRTFDLHPGDSLTFNSRDPHRWWNPGDRPALLVWVNTPPSF